MSTNPDDQDINSFMYGDPLHKAFSEITGKKSIHSPESIAEYKDVLGCQEKFVFSILNHGLLLPISDSIPTYEEDNNSSAKKNLQFLKDKVVVWEKQGYLRRVDKKPHCVNPMTVVSKLDLKSGEYKNRPCLDLSRNVNLHLQDWPTKLSHLDNSAVLLDPGDWQAALDLENMYFHVRIHPNHQKYLGFKIEDENGTPIYYVFSVMIYGLKVATTVVTHLIKPVVSYLHEKGVKFSIYIDDGRTVGPTAKITLDHHKMAIAIFEKCGWNIQKAKTSQFATQHLYY